MNQPASANPQIIRLNYPRPVIDRKPDDEPASPRIVINGAPASSSATVPQIMNILNSTPNVITAANAKKCTFHRQCLHIQSPPQAGQATPPVVQPQIQLPLQTPPQLLHHQQVQQQIRLNQGAASRPSTQANRDAITTNISPQLNAALLQDRYLLLDLVDGSSFYKCIDIQTQKMLVCKVSVVVISRFYLWQSWNLGSGSRIVFRDGIGTANRPFQFLSSLNRKQTIPGLGQFPPRHLQIKDSHAVSGRLYCL
jgi:hypothetical protein